MPTSQTHIGNFCRKKNDVLLDEMMNLTLERWIQSRQMGICTRESTNKYSLLGGFNLNISEFYTEIVFRDPLRELQQQVLLAMGACANICLASFGYCLGILYYVPIYGHIGDGFKIGKLPDNQKPSALQLEKCTARRRKAVTLEPCD